MAKQTTYLVSGNEFVAIPERADATQIVKDFKAKTGRNVSVNVYDENEIEDNAAMGFIEQPVYGGALLSELLAMFEQYSDIAQGRWDVIGQDLIAYN